MTAGASLDVEMREAGQAQGILSEVRPVEVTEGEDGVVVGRPRHGQNKWTAEDEDNNYES